MEAQTAGVQRPAARIAAGRRPLGRSPRTDPVAHRPVGDRARAVADAPADWLVALGYPHLDPASADLTVTTTAWPTAA